MYPNSANFLAKKEEAAGLLAVAMSNGLQLERRLRLRSFYSVHTTLNAMMPYGENRRYATMFETSTMKC